MWPPLFDAYFAGFWYAVQASLPISEMSLLNQTKASLMIKKKKKWKKTNPMRVLAKTSQTKTKMAKDDNLYFADSGDIVLVIAVPVYLKFNL